MRFALVSDHLLLATTKPLHFGWSLTGNSTIVDVRVPASSAFQVLPYLSPSSETQGQSVGPGEKARRKFSSTGGKAPGYRLSPDHFQTVKRMLAPDWPQKMLCIIVPNRRTASPEFFLVNSYTTAIDSITACLAHTPKKCTQQ